MYDIKAEPEVVARGAVSTWQGYSHVRAQRTANWLRRMVPHVFGWFTMTSVWFILIVQLENAKRDIDEISDRNIPDWVNALVRRIDPPLHPPSETKRHLVVACSNRSTAPS